MKEISRLKCHVDVMKKELDYTTKQIKLLEKNRKVSDWEKIDHVNGKSIDELKHQEKNLSQEITQIQKEIKKSQSKTLIITELSLLPVVVLLILISGLGNSIMDFTNDETTSFKTRHLIENLRGDTVDTWKSWRLVGTTLNVNVLNAKGLSENRIDVIKNAITSEESLEIDDVTNLSDEQLGTILRHEFGHAIGLGHSTAPEDLMAPNIDMTVPYISECNTNAIRDLYNGIQGSTVCEK